MALVVEDGTGLSNANAYVSLAEVTTYATDRGLVWTATDPVKEQSIAKATDYIDAMYKFLGIRNGPTQALSWPRTGVTDRYEGYAVASNVIPAALKKSVSELAIKVASGAILIQDLERGGAIKSAAVGPVSVTYMDNASATTLYGITGLLKGFIRDDDYDKTIAGMRLASTTQPDAAFRMNQFDNTGAYGDQD